MNLNKINKKEFGEAVIPEKIFKFNYRGELEKLYEKLYFDNVHYVKIANLFFVSQILSLIFLIVLYPSINNYFYDTFSGSVFFKFLILFLIVTVFNFFFYYFSLLVYFFYHDIKFRKIEKEIEEDLPEFIDNLVSNLKGGISLEKALLKSVRKEQIALLKEVTLINEKIMMGKNIEEALGEFKDRFDSPIISRTFFLIEEGLKGGGNLAQPLEKISQNLKKIYELNEEIKSNAGGFAFVIQLITIFVTPLLFALALTLLTFIGNLFALLSKSNADVISVNSVPVEFTNYLMVFSYAMIVMITFFSSLIISQLKNEKIYEALKYLPISILVSLVIYMQASKLLLNFFGSII